MFAATQESVLTLTDDEVVAVAIAERTYFIGDLPTVEADSEQDLLRAALRGRRSLIARGWIGDGGDLAEELAPVRDAVGASGFVNVFIGNDELSRLDWGLAASIYPHAAGWVIDGVDGAGLHRLARTSKREACDALNALVSAAFAGGDEQPLAEGAWLIVSVLKGDSSRLLATRPGAVRSASIQDSRLSPWVTASAADVVGWITMSVESIGDMTS